MKQHKNLIYLVLIVIVIVVVFHFLMRNKLLKPVDGKITSDFGNRIHPISGVTKFHNGIDIGASTGTPIKAPFSGKINSIYYNSAGGNSLILIRKDGLRAGFAHLSKYNVQEYDSVKMGDVIGYVGSTGAVTGSHLHFTIKNKKGEFIDPKKLIV